MKRTAALLLVFSLLIGCAPQLAKEISVQGQSKNEDIKKLLDLTVSDSLMDTYLEGFLNAFTGTGMPGGSDIPKEDLKVLNEVIKEVLMEEYPKLMEKMVPLYDKYFTHEEIKQLIVFYESPVGLKMLEVQPDLVRESMSLGQQWGISLAPKLQIRMKERGLI